MFNQTTTVTANGANLIVNISQPGDLVAALPYSEALELARNIIANGGDPAGLNALKFMVNRDIYEMIDHGDPAGIPGQYEVRLTYRNPCVTTISRFYGDFLVALAELQRQYHEGIGWFNGLDAAFVPANDHQANGRRDRQENEIRLCADLDETMIRF